MADQLLVALAGQPNSGKSTVFNMLTGARQHVANYPGVTVEKKVGRFSFNGSAVEMVDLPGTYSLTSYSLEERVARDFVIRDRPAVIVNVVDASNIQRHLFLTFQLLEMGAAVVISLNMMDVARGRGQEIDVERLERLLGVPVVPTVGRKGLGADELRRALARHGGAPDTADRAADAQPGAPFRPDFRVDYGDLEPAIARLEAMLDGESSLGLPARWLAVKLLEGDEGARRLAMERMENASALLEAAAGLRRDFRREAARSADSYIEERRYAQASAIAGECVHAPRAGQATLSDKVDRIVCHRVLGYPILFGVLYLMYYLSIELGYELTNYSWPVLAKFREIVANILPMEGFASDPMLRALVLWLVDSVNALLNYIPIFLLLFSYIAFLEDLGYMPRMAFLLDAFFRRFGLHGQSTLPLVLGGVYVGGCAVPGVMASRAVSDERARLATILVVPMMNCLAKVPLYVLLIGVYFTAYKAQALFFIATVTILMALVTAKLLNLSVLKDKETAPFIMEMPPYHAPTVGNIVRSGLERVWLYVRKITTVVAAVSVILFVLMQFPGVSSERHAEIDAQVHAAQAAFFKAASRTSYGPAVDTPEKIDDLFAYQDRYKSARTGITDKAAAQAVDERFIAENEPFFTILKPKGDKEAKAVGRAFKKLRGERLRLRAEVREEVINRSFLGSMGRLLEPVTQWAGFNWRVNVALLSALAAKENVVATLGALYQPTESAAMDDAAAQADAPEEGGAAADGAGPEQSAVKNAQGRTEAPVQGGAKALEQRMAEQETGFTPLHALALMLFMALYPPCMATTMVVKVQSGSWKWMFFSLAYMTGLGAVVATLVFTGGRTLGLTGVEAMAWFYGLVVTATIVAGLIKPQPTDS